MKSQEYPMNGSQDRAEEVLCSPIEEMLEQSCVNNKACSQSRKMLQHLR